MAPHVPWFVLPMPWFVLPMCIFANGGGPKSKSSRKETDPYCVALRPGHTGWYHWWCNTWVPGGCACLACLVSQGSWRSFLPWLWLWCTQDTHTRRQHSASMHSRAFCSNVLLSILQIHTKLSPLALVGRPTQLIYISDIYLLGWRW